MSLAKLGESVGIDQGKRSKGNLYNSVPSQ